MKFFRPTILIILALLLGACQKRQSLEETNSDNGQGEAVLIDEDIDEYLSILSFDEGLEALAARFVDPSTDWQSSFVSAYEHVHDGDTEAAIEILRSIADDESNEIGLRLWAWNGLRELGVSSEDNTVYAYIFQVNVGDNKTDILVVYNDGRLRFISGQLGLSGMFVWENYDSSHALNQKAISSLQLAQPTLAFAHSIPQHLNTVPDEDAPRLTLLTFNGLYLVDIPSDANTDEMQAFWQSASETLLLVVQTRDEYSQTQSAP